MNTFSLCHIMDEMSNDGQLNIENKDLDSIEPPNQILIQFMIEFK